MGRRTRTMLIASLALWVVAVAIGVASLATEHARGCGHTLTGGGSTESVYRQQWRWWPPGEWCVYKVTPGDIYPFSAPPATREDVIGLLILWPLSVIVVARASASDRRRDLEAESSQPAGRA